MTTAASGSEASVPPLFDRIRSDHPRCHDAASERLPDLSWKSEKKGNAPILFLSARTKDSDKTLGFSSGGDDYLAKPFSYSELTSRVRALLRRYRVYQGKQQQETPAKNSCVPRSEN